MEKLDILVMAVHPDDAELCCSGTIARHIDLGYKVGILDFTHGEMGTRGTGEIRLQEAQKAAEILKLTVRENLGLQDAHFVNDVETRLKIIRVIRKYKPQIVIANAPKDRHPDHGRASALATEACFYSGLHQLKSFDEHGSNQEAWRPEQVFHYIQDSYLEPDFVVDISAYWPVKDASVRAFKSQFYDPNSTEPESYIASPEFLQFVEARAKVMGHKIGVHYGEGFIAEKKLKITDLSTLL